MLNLEKSVEGGIRVLFKCDLEIRAGAINHGSTDFSRLKTTQKRHC